MSTFLSYHLDDLEMTQDIPEPTMTKLSMTIPIFLFALALLVSIGCFPSENTSDNGQETRETATEPVPEPEADPYQPAKLLAKRLVLYWFAYQERDVAPFTATPEALAGKDYPEVPLQINSLWWTIAEDAHIAPLPALAMSSIEPEAFQYMVTEVVESDDDVGWVLLTVGYDASMIKLLISDAHEEWPMEVRESFLMRDDDGCLHVWCGLINGEWKLIAKLPCSPDEEAPTPPDVRFDSDTGRYEPAEDVSGEDDGAGE